MLRLRPPYDPARAERTLSKLSPLILSSIILFFLIHGLYLIPQSNGGGDLVNADIPKSLMLLNGQNPYSVQPWASPYPPLLLLVDSGLIRLTTIITSQTNVDLISQNLRIIGLIADISIALMIYLYLRGKTGNPVTPPVSAGLFLTLPALSISPLYFFHSDTFGYPILALSIIALADHRYMIGTSLLATATIFKIHPILAVPLVLVWLVRTLKLHAALPSITISSSILGLGLAAPLIVPGYTSSVLGFNLSNDGNGTTVLSLLGLANNILPQQLQYTPTTQFADQVWITTTLAIYTVTLGIVYMKARSLRPVDVVLLGLVAWLIPLKIVFTHYTAWAIIPILMRGRLAQTIPILAMLQAADTLSYWSWWPNTSPLPGIDSFYGLVATSMIYRGIGVVALGFIIYTIRSKSPILQGQEQWRQLADEKNRISVREEKPLTLPL